MILETLRVEHFATLRPQAAQCGDDVPDLTNPRYQHELASCDGSWAAVQDGVTCGVGGIIDLGGGRGYAWTWVAGDITNEFLAMHRKVIALLEAAPYHRIEMHVRCDHVAGARWARLLGFELESTARHFFRSGRDAFLFARVTWKP